MALGLDNRRRLPAALQSLLQREFDQALRRLEQAASDRPGDRVTGVHEFRRSVKRLRATLRLVRGAVPDRELSSIDRALGGAARRLGELRDAHARSLAAARLVRLVPRSMRALAMDAWRAGCEAGAGGGTPMRAAAVQALLRQSRVEMEMTRVRVGELDLSRVDAKLVAAAAADVWRRARERFRTDWQDRDEAWLHDVRKRAQRMANLLLVIAPAAGAWAVRTERRLRVVTGLLGEARDAELMAQDMPEQAPGSALQVPARRLRLAAQRHRQKCLRAARLRGASAMAESRGDVRRRLRAALDPSH